jgi:CRISPR/Cas system CMR-associated protein Cmr5 small subunit
MLDKIDFVSYKQVETPESYVCASGHIAPKTFKIDGPEGEDKPIRFFEVSGKNIKTKVYCEVCLVIVNYLAKQMKGKK